MVDMTTAIEMSKTRPEVCLDNCDDGLGFNLETAAELEKTAAEQKKAAKALDKDVRNGVTVSIAYLMALVAEIIESSMQCHALLQKALIKEAKASMKLTKVVAARDHLTNALKYGIQAGTAMAQMAVAGAAGCKMARGAGRLKNKNLINKDGPKDVSKLSTEDINKFTADKQGAHTQKWSAISQNAQVLGSMGQAGGNLAALEGEESVARLRATKEEKDKLDQQINESCRHMTEQLVTLNNILEKITQAGLVTNR